MTLSEGRALVSPIDAAALVERFYFEVWDHANEGVAREILHPQLTFRGSLGSLLSGRDRFIDYLRQVQAALAGYRCVIGSWVHRGPPASTQHEPATTQRPPMIPRTIGPP